MTVPGRKAASACIAYEEKHAQTYEQKLYGMTMVKVTCLHLSIVHGAESVRSLRRQGDGDKSKLWFSEGFRC